MTESKFKVGDVVILQNLKIHPECNGLETTVISPGELREPLRGSDPMPVEYLYEVDINLASFEPGLLVAEYQMRHRKPPVELGTWSVIQEAANWNPTDVTANVDSPVTPLPAPDLRSMQAIKYELREDMEPRDLLGTFTLECGRVVGVSGLHVMATYGGLLEGTPNAEMDNRLIKSFRRSVKAYWGDRPTHVIAPVIYHLESHCGRTSRWMPPVTYHAWLQSAALGGSGKFASELVVIWFGEREKDLSLLETTKRALRQLSWEELAGECDLD